jgi:ABC-2 type transport system permease protein
MRRPRAKFILALARSEWLAFWTGGAGGVSLFVFLALSGLLFYNSAAAYAAAGRGALVTGEALDAGVMLFSGAIPQLGLIILLVTPLSTMRAFSPSHSGGHWDLLLSWPVSRLEADLALWLGSFLSLSLTALLSLLPWAMLTFFGVGSFGLLLTSLLGFLLLTAAAAAVGLACASLAPGPLAASLATLGVLGALWALGWAAPYLPQLPAYLAQGLGIAPRLAHFALGFIDLNDAVYFLVLTIGGLAVTRPLSA